MVRLSDIAISRGALHRARWLLTNLGFRRPEMPCWKSEGPDIGPLTRYFRRKTGDKIQKEFMVKHPILQPIGKDGTLKDHTVQVLADAILTGKRKPGDRLNESQLARDLHVSRAPVREELRQLQDQSVVVNVPRRGM